MPGSRKPPDRELARPGETGAANNDGPSDSCNGNAAEIASSRRNGRRQRPGESGAANDDDSCNCVFMLCFAVALMYFIGSWVSKTGTELQGSADHLRLQGPAWVPEDGAPFHVANMQARLAELKSEAVDGPAATDDRPYDYDLLILMPTTSEELARREAVRGGWTKYLASPHCEACRRYKVHAVFVVGSEGNVTASHIEAKEKGDLGVEELHDFRREGLSDSRRTLLSIRYAVRHFTFRFLLKCNLDSWVYVDRLLELFETRKLWKRALLYAGNFEAGDGAAANQDENSKWYDPLYPALTGFDRYPKHAKGAGYILSRLLAEALANEPDDYWADLPCEDVAVGFWLAAVRNDKLEIPVSLDPACDSAAIVDHYITPEIMAERWRNYAKHGSPCQNNIRRFGGGGLEPFRIDTDDVDKR